LLGFSERHPNSQVVVTATAPRGALSNSPTHDLLGYRPALVTDNPLARRPSPQADDEHAEAQPTRSGRR
jgi:hypothetical protein